MAIKVFIRDMDRGDYVSVPADAFRIQGTYRVSRSAGDDGITPQADEITYAIQFPLSSDPSSVYQALYAEILDRCATNGWETPAKTDIFGWIPMDFSLLIP